VNVEEQNQDRQESGEPAGPAETAPATDVPPSFWSAAVELDDLELPTLPDLGPTLERLGPSPFPRSGFPLVGFLATVYDHVLGYAQERDETPSDPSAPGGSD
jgi:hypothetical protein